MLVSQTNRMVRASKEERLGSQVVGGVVEQDTLSSQSLHVIKSEERVVCQNGTRADEDREGRESFLGLEPGLHCAKEFSVTRHLGNVEAEKTPDPLLCQRTRGWWKLLRELFAVR